MAEVDDLIVVRDAEHVGLLAASQSDGHDDASDLERTVDKFRVRGEGEGVEEDEVERVFRNRSQPLDVRFGDKIYPSIFHNLHFSAISLADHDRSIAGLDQAFNGQILEKQR